MNDIQLPEARSPLACNSLRRTRFTQAETLASPSCCAACCIASLRAGSTLIAICRLPRGKLLFSLLDMCLTPDYCLGTTQVYDTRHSEATKPEGATNTAGPLTTAVMGVTKMAKAKFTFVLAQGKQRIAAMRRIRFITVLAGTEQEARLLAGGPSLVFVSRCPAREVAA